MELKPLIGRHGFIIGSESHKIAVKELREMLSVFHRYAVETKLMYWAEFGTLIGVYRHGDITPWDEDIDLGVAVHDWDRLSGLWTSAGEEQPYRRPQGTPWNHWYYKNVVLCGVRVKMLKFGGKDGRFKLKPEFHTTFACDVSGVDLYRRPRIAGHDVDQAAPIISPHRFGNGVIMAPKRDYAESYLCDSYGRDWCDWKSFLENHYQCRRKDEYEDISLATFYAYCSDTQDVSVKKQRHGI